MSERTGVTREAVDHLKRRLPATAEAVETLRQAGPVRTRGRDMTPQHVEWDVRNLAHLLNSDISPSEVDEVLRSPTSLRRRIAGGRRIYHGPTLAGRRLTVIVDVLGPDHLRPRTAREIRGA